MPAYLHGPESLCNQSERLMLLAPVHTPTPPPMAPPSVEEGGPSHAS